MSFILSLALHLLNTYWPWCKKRQESKRYKVFPYHRNNFLAITDLKFNYKFTCVNGLNITELDKTMEGNMNFSPSLYVKNANQEFIKVNFRDIAGVFCYKRWVWVEKGLWMPWNGSVQLPWTILSEPVNTVWCWMNLVELKLTLQVIYFSLANN